MADDPQVYRINIDERWEVYDLHKFPHLYSQLYGLLYSLEPDRVFYRRENDPFRKYPWIGGYSAVNFYNDLYFYIDKNHRPLIQTIKYSSPGYIDILGILAIATSIALSVSTVAKAVDIADEVYTNIFKRAQQRKLLSQANEIEKQQREIMHQKFILESIHEIAEPMRFTRVNELQHKTHDSLVSLKILLSYYRRDRELTYYVTSGKVSFDQTEKFKD